MHGQTIRRMEFGPGSVDLGADDGLKRHGTGGFTRRICGKEAFKPSEGGEDLIPKTFALNQFRRPDWRCLDLREDTFATR
jgi:hypothetical protein